MFSQTCPRYAQHLESHGGAYGSLDALGISPTERRTEWCPSLSASANTARDLGVQAIPSAKSNIVLPGMAAAAAFSPARRTISHPSKFRPRSQQVKLINCCCTTQVSCLICIQSSAQRPEGSNLASPLHALCQRANLFVEGHIAQPTNQQ